MILSKKTKHGGRKRSDITIRPLQTNKSLDSLKDEIFEINEYKIMLDEIRGQHIQKYSKILDTNQVIAVKEVNINMHPDTSSMEPIKKQIEILKMLQILPQVIKFY
ncbi:hypothetical protein F8M41_005320 [Gigaspora margarita]|uniref:Uncharacterized protein n=1 Tax=Gigaspora margarita TaxID=4874 RepID=A0A8H4AXD5_GIGMA|nr:hypothetical protein F8M41_005320 [Gigaspora margarita]